MPRTEGRVVTFEEERRLLRQRVRELVDLRVLSSVSIMSERMEVVRGGCPHGRDVVLWCEVSRPVYENLADRLKPGDRIPFGTKPEEWTRVASVWMDIEDVHPLMRRSLGIFEFAKHEGLCVVCGHDERRAPGIFDVTGRPRRST